MKKTLTLILVANGSRAKYFSHAGPGKGLAALPTLNLEHELKKTRDIQADKPGRTFDRSGNHRHSMEYSSDPKDVERTRFARELARHTQKAMQKTQAQRLVVVASPHMLADLRKSFTPTMHDSVYGELDKDLTASTEQEIASHLEKILPV